MDKQDVKLAKEKILKCLTENFDYGKRKDGTPLKRRKKNRALFIKSGFGKGRQVFHDTSLDMIMDAVVLGLYLAMDDSKSEPPQAGLPPQSVAKIKKILKEANV